MLAYMYMHVFLLSYRNTHESLGELKKAMETLACNSTCFLLLNWNRLSLHSEYQHGGKRMSESQWLVQFALGLVDSVLD